MKCEYCNQEMSTAEGCTLTTVSFGDGVTLPAIVHDMTNRCHDCGCTTGHYHHPGCDMERCPRCGGQLISCWCGESEDEDGRPLTAAEIAERNAYNKVLDQSAPALDNGDEKAYNGSNADNRAERAQ